MIRCLAIAVVIAVAIVLVLRIVLYFVSIFHRFFVIFYRYSNSNYLDPQDSEYDESFEIVERDHLRQLYRAVLQVIEGNQGLPRGAGQKPKNRVQEVEGSNDARVLFLLPLLSLCSSSRSRRCCCWLGSW